MEWADLNGDGFLTDDEKDIDGDGITNWDEAHGRMVPPWWQAAYPERDRLHAHVSADGLARSRHRRRHAARRRRRRRPRRVLERRRDPARQNLGPAVQPVPAGPDLARLRQSTRHSTASTRPSHSRAAGSRGSRFRSDGRADRGHGGARRHRPPFPGCRRPARSRLPQPVERRPARGEPPTWHEYRAELAVGVPFLVAAIALALLGDSGTPLQVGPAIALVLSYARRSRACASTPASATPCRRSWSFVPMLFLLPTQLVPLLVLLGMLVGNLPDYVARRAASRPRADAARRRVARGRPGARAAARPARRRPRGATGRGYVPALGAQFAIDLGVYAVRARLALDIPSREQLSALAWVWLVDALLAPIGAARRVRRRSTARTPSCSCCRSRAADAVRARAQRAARPGARAGRRLPRHRDAARRPAGGRPTSTPAATTRAASSRCRWRSPTSSGSTSASATTSSWPRCCTTSARSSIPDDDHQQARPARRRRVGADEDAHGRGPADARPRRRRAARGRA